MSTVGSWGSNRNNNSGYVKKEYFKLKDGDNIYRILPPFGTLAKTGALGKFYSVFFLTGSDRSRKKVVASPFQKGRDGSIVTRCPLTEKFDALTKKLKAMKDAGTFSDADVEMLTEITKNLRPDKKYYLNAMDQSGKIGLLKLPYKAWQGAKKELDRLLDEEGINAIDAGSGNGVFLKIQRYKDDKKMTNYQVVSHMVSRRTEDGRISKEYAMAPIDENVLKRMETEASDLANLYKTFSQEELSLLATLDPKAIDTVFAKGSPTEAVTAEDFDNAEDDAVIPDFTGKYTVAASMETKTSVTPPVTTNKVATTQNADDLINQFIKGN